MPESSEHQAIAQERSVICTGFKFLMYGTLVAASICKILQSTKPAATPAPTHEKTEKKETQHAAVLIDQLTVCFDFASCQIWIDGQWHSIEAIDCGGKRASNADVRAFLGSVQPNVLWNTEGLHMQSELGSITIPPHVVRSFLAEQRGDSSISSGVDNMMCTLTVCGMPVPMSCNVICKKMDVEETTIASAEK